MSRPMPRNPEGRVEGTAQELREVLEETLGQTLRGRLMLRWIKRRHGQYLNPALHWRCPDCQQGVEACRCPFEDAEGWQPWPRWRITRHGRAWYAWGPTTVAGDTHPCDKHFATFTEACDHANQKARGQ